VRPPLDYPLTRPVHPVTRAAIYLAATAGVVTEAAFHWIWRLV
jgi:hypothetical protein